MKSFITALFVLFIFPTVTLSADIYLDATPGEDCSGNYNPATKDCDGSGSYDSYDTLTEIISNISAGDDVIIRAGTYGISANVSTSADGTSEDPITYQMYEDESATFNSTVNDKHGCISYNGSDYHQWDADNMTFTYYQTFFDIGEDNSTTGFKISYAVATAQGSGGDNAGFVSARANTVNETVEYCDITGPGHYFQGGGPVHGNTACIYHGAANNPTYKNNNLSNAPIGIYLKHAGTGGTISYNYITDTDRFGIFNNQNNATFEHNIIGDSTVGGDFRSRFNEANGGAGGDGNTWNHNTLSDQEMELLSDLGGADNNTFTNNIFSAYEIRGEECDGNTWDYNMYESDSAIGANDLGTTSPTYVGGGSPSTIAGFALDSGSNGENAGNDGEDMGADVTLVGAGSDLPTTPTIKGLRITGMKPN